MRHQKDYAPGLDKVPVGKVLLQIIGISRAGPVDQVEVNIVETKALEGGVDPLRNAMVPGVIKLGGDPDLFAGNARIPDTLANLVLVAIGQSTRRICQHWCAKQSKPEGQDVTYVSMWR